MIVFSYLWLPYMILPLYAGLERIPDSLLEASSDLGGKAGRTFRRVILPLAFPALVAGSIFTFALTLGDFIAPQIVMAGNQFIGNVVYANVGVANNLPLAAAFATVPVAVMVVYLVLARRAGSVRLAVTLGPVAKWLLRVGTALTLVFVYLPIVVIALYAFNESRIQAWPIKGFTLEWFDRALHNPGVRDALSSRSRPRSARRSSRSCSGRSRPLRLRATASSAGRRSRSS